MEQRNLIMAVVASVTILLGWQFLYEQPQIPKEMAAREAAELASVKSKAVPDSQGAPVPSPSSCVYTCEFGIPLSPSTIYL